MRRHSSQAPRSLSKLSASLAVAVALLAQTAVASASTETLATTVTIASEDTLVGSAVEIAGVADTLVEPTDAQLEALLASVPIRDGASSLDRVAAFFIDGSAGVYDLYLYSDPVSGVTSHALTVVSAVTAVGLPATEVADVLSYIDADGNGVAAASNADVQTERTMAPEAFTTSSCVGCDLGGLAIGAAGLLVCTGPQVLLCGAIFLIGGTATSQACNRLACSSKPKPSMKGSQLSCGYDYCELRAVVRNENTQLMELRSAVYWAYGIPGSSAKLKSGAYASDHLDPSASWPLQPIRSAEADIYTVKHYTDEPAWARCATETVYVNFFASWSTGYYQSDKWTKNVGKPWATDCPGYRAV